MKAALPAIDRRTTLKGVLATGLVAGLFGDSAAANGQDPAVLQRLQPFRNHRFLVEIDGIAKAGFLRVLLPDATIDDVEYREGNDLGGARKLAGITRQDTLVLETGVTEESFALFEWFKSVQDGQVVEGRRSVAVTLLDARGEAAARWEFRNAWPVRYDAPDLDALPGRSRDRGGGADNVAIETLELTHEGMERVA